MIRISQNAPAMQRINLPGRKVPIEISGPLSPEQFDILRETLLELHDTSPALLSGVSQISVTGELGLVQHEPEQDPELLRAFTLDSKGRVLLARPVCNRVRDCLNLFRELLTRHHDFLLARRTASRMLWKKRDEIIAEGKARPGFRPPEPGAPYGWWHRSHFIERDAPIEGGVYVLSNPECRIAVDLPSAVDVLYGQLRTRFSRRASGPDERSTVYLRLEEVYRMAFRAFPIGAERSGQDFLDHYIRHHDGTVPLSRCVEAGAAIPEAVPLVIGLLLERLHRDHQLPPDVRVSIDRHWDGELGHAWVRVTFREMIVVLDPSEQFFGMLHEFDRQHRSYLRPEDDQPVCVPI